MKLISAEAAVALIEDGWCVVPGGFGSCGHPDALTAALRERFLRTGTPRNLALLFGPGPGDKQGKGIDAIALPGLVSRAIGGFWGLCPQLAAMARSGEIEAHNWPQGVISRMFSAIASKSPGILTHVGLDTFVDPDVDGGVFDTRGSTPLVEKVAFKGQVSLFYPAQRVDCVLLRGTAADRHGNITFIEETSYMDALAQAQAARNCGGIVIVQVKSLIDGCIDNPRDIRIPGFLVDYIVLADEADHPQTYGCAHHPDYTRNGGQRNPLPEKSFPLAKELIAYRAALELRAQRHQNVNLGIGIPALVGASAHAMGLKNFTLTVESGVTGGVPDEGLSFGAVFGPEAVIEQSAMFDFYDGGGLDLAFLGFAEADVDGNVNVSRFNGRFTGAGGFINISQSAKKIVFCGTLTAGGLEVTWRDGRLHVQQEGQFRKFGPRVAHLTFNGRTALDRGQEVMFITERAVFALTTDGLELREIADGIEVRDVQALLGFPCRVSPTLATMPQPSFTH
jgi:propionate CoA-transferase